MKSFTDFDYVIHVLMFLLKDNYRFRSANWN